MTENEAVRAAMRTPGLCVEPEMRFLYRLAAQCPEGLPMVELGTFRGRSTAILCGVAQETGSEVVTIDNYVHDPFFKTKEQRIHSPEWHASEVADNLLQAGHFRPQIIIGDSTIVPDGQEAIGLLFIDSEHTRERFFKELDAWLPLLVKGGIAAFHDYKQPTWIEMTPAINERFVGMPDNWDYLGRKIWLIGFRRRR